MVRGDELEDIVSAVGQTFLGLTVHCARCHAHKFDPVSQQEYYQLTAALAGVRHGQRQVISSQDQRQADQLAKQIAAGKKKIAIFYGAGHMSDFEKRIRKKFKLAPVKTRWLVAWAMKSPE